ncbi:MAG: STAS domain-containing protein, partial [Polyangiaceae bacterium]
AIDSVRAQQVMDTVLLRVVEEKAKCIIIDIAGVPVVDTKVADNLVKTTSSVRLLGAQTILTGISAQVARTMVQLGVDISAMHTLSSLAEGIELSLDLLGKAITTKARSRTNGTRRRREL